MVILVALVIGGWELYLRQKGVPIAYDDGKELWSDQRAMVYEPPSRTTVFIGSSRIKFDLDLDTWQKLTGRHAVQLAIEGSSPVPILEDLAADPGFAGKLVIDVTEPIFFSGSEYNAARPRENINYYHKQTPAQRASFILNHALESKLIFLDKEFLSLNTGLDQLHIPNRPGVSSLPMFPLDFRRANFSRQNKMDDRFLADTALRHRVQTIWLYTAKAAVKGGGVRKDPTPGIMHTVVQAVDRIRARGGEVIFLRLPCSGPMEKGENSRFPRAKFWDPLLAATHCAGFHYTDHPETSHFICPEWSHLSPADAVIYTRALIEELPASFVH